jgi:biopolymer transport protein ExbD
MSHPDASDLLDYSRGELPAERSAEIEEHLNRCEECRQEYEALGKLERHLEAWGDEQATDSFVEQTLERMEAEGVPETPGLISSRGHIPGSNNHLWFRRSALAAGAIAATLLFQTLIWNPFSGPITFQTFLSLAPTASAMPAGQAVPDTVLVLTIHPDKKFSTTLLSGQYELDELIEELTARIEKGSYRTILLVGTDPDEPVTFQTDKLQPLLDKLEISTLKVGEGVAAIQISEIRDLITRVVVPVETVEVEPTVRYLYVSRPDSLIRHAIADSIRVAVSRRDSTRIWTDVVVRPIEVQITPRVEGRRIQLRTRPMVEVRIRDPLAEAMLDSLRSPKQAVLTVGEGGIILMNTAAVPFDEVEESLKRLLEQNADIAILILVLEERGENDPGYRIVEIANRLGITNIAIKKVKKPPAY